jgi:hypothetical protein
MVHSTEDHEEPALESQVDTDRIEQMRAVLDEKRLGLLQQLLASDFTLICRSEHLSCRFEV